MRHLAWLTLLFAVLMPLPSPAAAATEDDVRLLALNMYHEAKGQGRQGMLAVGWVVLNRLHDRSFPANIEQVITQGRAIGRCQWSWLCDGLADEPREIGQYRLAEGLARELLGPRPPADPTHGALWLRSTRLEAPSWSVKVVRTARLGGHDFYARQALQQAFVAQR